ncbi:MAG: NAD-binding protein [Betaproteobacteria bacterium]|nr:NAD-binding protein [Betaproteobacteria bacterium]
MAEDRKESRLLARLLRVQLFPRRGSDRRVRLLVRQEASTAARTLAVRVVLVLALFLSVLAVFWLDREGLRDASDGVVSFLDVVYFTMVTVTTVGYGDIVPVTDRARLIDSFFVTPIRFFVLFIFVGTAYQMVFQRMMEERRMKKLEDSLSDHVIVCGFGHSGRIAAVELVAKGEKPEHVVVIDQNEGAARAASEAGFVALVGSCTSEEIMRRAVVQKARAILICVGRDDTSVLATLTARHLSEKLRIIVSVRENENAKLARQGGADVIVSPARVGGYLLADAVESAYTVGLINELLTERGRVRLSERAPQADEIGRKVRSLPCLVIGVEREKKRIMFWDLGDTEVTADDLMLVIEGPAEERGAAG